jgi:hypothetical protein
MLNREPAKQIPYELVLQPAPGRQSMPRIDLVVLSSGTQVPLNSELCIQ